jgi:hypothetical protein
MAMNSKGDNATGGSLSSKGEIPGVCSSEIVVPQDVGEGMLMVVHVAGFNGGHVASSSDGDLLRSGPLRNCSS